MDEIRVRPSTTISSNHSHSEDNVKMDNSYFKGLCDDLFENSLVVREFKDNEALFLYFWCGRMDKELIPQLSHIKPSSFLV